MMKTVSIKETSRDVWRVAIDGRVPGDSRGFNRTQAEEEARTMVQNETRWATRDNRPIELCLSSEIQK